MTTLIGVAKLRAFLTLTLGLLLAFGAQAAEAKRKIIIDQDAFGPASSNLQAILMLLQAPDVEVLGITVTSGDGWRDEEVGHLLRLLEIAGRTERREFNMRWDPEAASIVLHQPWPKILQVPVDPTTKTFFKPEFFKTIAKGKAPFDDYLAKFGQSFPMWDELAAAVWLDPSIITKSSTVLEDVDTGFSASYGNTLSWAVGAGPGLGERPVQAVLDIDLPKFEQMTIDLLSRPTPKR